jgi:type I restriction enzyme M protein
LRVPIAEVKRAIFDHAEFAAFNAQVMALFAQWRSANVLRLKGFGKDGHPKKLIETLSEDLLATFRAAPLLDAYDVYQHLMDLWAAAMQDDCYLISADGWIAGARPRELVQVKNRDGKLVWPEAEDFRKGRRRFKSDLVPRAVLIDRYFVTEREAIEAIEGELAAIEQQLDETREEQSGEDGLLSEVVEGEGEKQKITAKAIKARLKEIGEDPDYADERRALVAYAEFLDKLDATKKRLKAAEDELEAKLEAKYPALTEDEIKTLVVDDRWLATVETDARGELDRISQALAGRARDLAERYAKALPILNNEVTALAAQVDNHLKKMGAVWM